MIRTLIPLPVLGFVIFLMVDSDKRFKKLKADNADDAKMYERQYALMTTMLVVLILVLLWTMIYGLMKDHPSIYTKIFGALPESDCSSCSSYEY